ncbi:MAG: hypothetical protein JW864_11225 [Spirochaetes bacterium]|nr:hypothetical protein [Spirochaetota bacterium]
MRSLLCILTAAVFVIIFSTLSCTVKYYNTSRLLNDYTTEGFLDTDHYQVIVKGKPVNEAKGLVASRESALIDAKSRLKDKVLKSLTDYNYQYHIAKLNIKDEKVIQNIQSVKQELQNKMLPFYNSGYTAFEYYNPDNSAIIVYRIFRDNLVKKIESIEPDIKVREDEKNKETGK